MSSARVSLFLLRRMYHILAHTSYTYNLKTLFTQLMEDSHKEGILLK